MNFVAIDDVRRAECLNDLDGKCPERRQIDRVGLQHGEFVSPDACDEVICSDDLLEALGGLAQEDITNWITQWVVDILEMLQVDIENGKWLRAAFGRGKRPAKPIDKRPTIGQTR